MLYPLSCIGAHVSGCPNHILGRVTPFHTRGIVAMAGTFGYELDVTAISPEERRQIPGQIQEYQRIQALIQSGDYYRIASAAQDNGWDCQMIVSKVKDEAVLFLVRVLNTPNQHQKYLRLQGLDAESIYEDQETGRRYSGDVLCRVGMIVELPNGDFQGKMIHLRCAKSVLQ